ncbi:MAG: TonB-dependent receptor plug domain-containing protein, partial [Thiohalophilus sp.]
MKYRAHGATGLLGILLTMPVLAEELPQIAVEAEAEQQANKTTQPAEASQIGVPGDGGEWLSRTPGVAGVKMGSHGIDPVIRGQKQNQLNVLLDGAYVFGGCPNRMDPPSAYASTATYDQLTVIKGVESLLYGSGGSGGTVLFERQDPKFEPG